MDFQQQNILIGNLQIRYYGIIVVGAMLVGAWLAARLAARRKLNPDHIWGGLTWAIFPGIIGARLWFVLFPSISLTAGCVDPSAGPCQDLNWFIQNIGNLTNGPLAVWSGGLSIFGAVLGGLLGAWLYCSKYHNRIARFFFFVVSPLLLIVGLVLAVYGLVTGAGIPFVVGAIITIIFVGVTDEWLKYSWLPKAIWQRLRGKPVTPYQRGSFNTDFPDSGMPLAPWLDIAGVAMPLAQAIGRWANYVNQELYGLPTDLPWGITIPLDKRIGDVASGVEYPVDQRFHPLFLYESLLNLLLFFLLLNVFNRRRAQWRLQHGDIFLLYLMGYSLIRFMLEFLRVDFATIPGTAINSSQAFTLVVFLLAGGAFIYRRSTAPKTPTEPVTPAPVAE